METLTLLIDQFLIKFYRLTGQTGVDFVIGTLVLATIALLVGKASVFVALQFTRKQFQKKAAEAEKYHLLSLEALQEGDQEAYNAANKLANEAFGHSFFQQAALSAAFLWPVCFALAWMQHRFLDVAIPVPGTGLSLGFIGVFIILYVIVYFLGKRIVRLRGLSSKEAAPALDSPQNLAEPLLVAPPSLTHLSDKK